MLGGVLEIAVQDFYGRDAAVGGELGVHLGLYAGEKCLPVAFLSSFLGQGDDGHQLLLAAYDEGFGDGGVVVEEGFYLLGVDVLAVGGQDHELAAPLDEDVAILVYDAQVAGVEPSVLGKGVAGGLFVLEIACRDVHSSYLQLAWGMAWVIGRHTYLHPVHDLAAGAGHELVRCLVSDEGAAFRHSIAYGGGNMGFHHDVLDLRIHGCPSDGNQSYLAAQGLHEPFVYATVDKVGEAWDSRQQAHDGPVEDGLHLVLDDLFYDEGYGNQDVRPYLRKCLEQDGGGGHFGEEIDMASAQEGVQELEDEPVHVSEGQDAKRVVAFLMWVVVLCKGDVGIYAAGRQHDALGIAGRAGCVVDKYQFFRFANGVVDTVGSQAVGIGLVIVFLHVCEKFARVVFGCVQEGEVFTAYDGAYRGHGFRRHGFERLLVGKQEDTLGVVGECLYVVGGEVGQYGHSHGMVGLRGQEGDGPLGGVPGGYGHLVPLLHSQSFEDEVQLGYFYGNVVMREGLSVIIGESRLVPLLFDLLFQYGKKMFHNRCSFPLFLCFPNAKLSIYFRITK